MSELHVLRGEEGQTVTRAPKRFAAAEVTPRCRRLCRYSGFPPGANG